MSVSEGNLICANGHRSYSPNPQHWVTTHDNQRFCSHEHCYKRRVPVRMVDGEYQLVSPLSITPPMDIERNR